MEPTSNSKNTAHGFNLMLEKINLIVIFELSSEFNIQIINSLCFTWFDWTS